MIDELVQQCREAAPQGQAVVEGVVADALRDPERFAAALLAHPKPWFFAADDAVTVFCTEGRPGSASAPHDHGGWAVLGCFLGAEESWWHRRTADGLEVAGTSVVRPGDVHGVGADAIHSVMNRWDAPNGVIHVYGGNFLAADRHIWDPVSFEQHTAGLTEPHAPLPGGSTTAFNAPATEGLPALAGTAFAALAVRDPASVAAWLSSTLGLQMLVSQDDTCAVDETFTYLIEPTSLTIVGLHRHDEALSGGVDHLALRVPSVSALHQWATSLAEQGRKPSPITQWQFGSFVEIVGPESIRIRLFVPERRGP